MNSITILVSSLSPWQAKVRKAYIFSFKVLHWRDVILFIFISPVSIHRYVFCRGRIGNFLYAEHDNARYLHAYIQDANAYCAQGGHGPMNSTRHWKNWLRCQYVDIRLMATISLAISDIIGLFWTALTIASSDKGPAIWLLSSNSSSCRGTSRAASCNPAKSLIESMTCFNYCVIWLWAGRWQVAWRWHRRVRCGEYPLRRHHGSLLRWLRPGLLGHPLCVEIF